MNLRKRASLLLLVAVLFSVTAPAHADIDRLVEVEATNRSEDVDATSGDAAAANDMAVVLGLAVSTPTAAAQDISGVTALNIQGGDNDSPAPQLAEASSGDAVGGQVTGHHCRRLGAGHARQHLR